MICPECARDAGPIPQGAARCAKCGYEFVFQPETDGTSDAEWLDLTLRASGGDRHYFTENQLYSGYARGRVQVTRYVSRRGGLGVCMIVFGLGLWMYALKADWGLTLVLGIAITLSGVALVGTGVVTRRDPAAREPVTRWLAQWLARKPLPKLLRAGELTDAEIASIPKRIDYLLIVERELLVDLLLKNEAQHALSALVVAESGYPEALRKEAQRLLDERSDLKVIAVHDATPTGVGLKSRLAERSVLSLGRRTIIDAGLFPADIAELEELVQAIPPNHTSQVPLDFLSFRSLLNGLLSIAQGSLSLSSGANAEAPSATKSEPPQSDRATTASTLLS